MYVTKEELPPTPKGSSLELQYEQNPLQYYTSNNDKVRTSIFKYVLVGAAFICLFFGATRSGLFAEIFTLPVMYPSGMLTTNTGVFTMVVSSPTYGVVKATSMLPWDAVAEPYKPQTIALTNLVIDGAAVNVEDYSIEWDIGTSNVATKGSTATFQVDEVGVISCSVTGMYHVLTHPHIPSHTLSHYPRQLLHLHTLILSPLLPLPPLFPATNTLTSTKYTQDFTMAVKYVRREIRTLTDEDREVFFDALYKIYSVDASTGAKDYGDKFHTAEYFLWKHLTGAGTADCDHWHDGAGLVNNHVALTLEVEQALQAIDPTIAMPYWEYGMDNYLYKDWMSSPIFNADWFGEANPLNELHGINDGGRWSNLAMPDGAPYQEWDMQATGTINPFVNAYGHMRSPWNNNPSQLLGRHNTTYRRSIFTIPDCMTLQVTNHLTLHHYNYKTL